MKKRLLCDKGKKKTSILRSHWRPSPTYSLRRQLSLAQNNIYIYILAKVGQKYIAFIFVSAD